MQKLSPPVAAAVEAAIKAAAVIKKYSTNARVKTKEGHRSIVTKADAESEKKIFSHILRRFPDAKILAEEETNNPAAISANNPRGILGPGLRFVTDPLDGTVLFHHRLGGWSVGVGAIQNGKIIGGGVFAPTVNGGLLVFAERGKGVFFREGNGPIKKVFLPRRSKFVPGGMVVLTGADVTLFKKVLEKELEIAMNVRAVYVSGSSLLGLSFLALGRAGAFIQPPQRPWDWVPAYSAVIESGNIFKFYRIHDGKVIPVKNIDERAFAFPREKNGLGFIAGDPKLVQKIWEILPKTGWKNMNADTVSGLW